MWIIDGPAAPPRQRPGLMKQPFFPLKRMASIVVVMRLVVACGAATGVASAQPRTTDALPATLSAGWAAFDAGRFRDASAIANRILAEAPTNHSAQLLLVSALAPETPVAALDAYDALVARSGAADRHLSAAIGEAVLRQLAQTAAEPALRLAAAEALVEHQALGARALFVEVTKAAGRAGLASQAKAGDERAVQALAGQLDELPGSAKVGALGQLAQSGAAGALQALVKASRDPDEMVRMAAADGLRRLADPAAVPTLASLLSDRSGSVRQAAALALTALGDSRGDSLVNEMLNSGVADIVLTSAEALPNDSSRWTNQVAALLSAEDVTDRLRAARLLFAARRTEAESEIANGLASENPAVREEAARTASAVGYPVPPTTLREMLQDSSGWVRLAAAQALVRGSAGP
jgi:HEAT repeat protein